MTVPGTDLVKKKSHLVILGPQPRTMMTMTTTMPETSATTTTSTTTTATSGKSLKIVKWWISWVPDIK